MKVALKYIWSLLIVPPLLFLKGDLSFETMLQVHDIVPQELFEQKVQSAMGEKAVKELIVKVQVEDAQDSKFTGDGLTINLYDKNYGYIQKSQVIKGQIRFRLVGKNALPETFILVSPETLDEVVVNDSDTDKILVLHNVKQSQ
ncbi:MAG: hypothetical protein ACOVP1_06500 [Bacteroidia bacterium]